MKPSKLWSISILIALVILLGAANANSQNPSPSLREKFQPPKAEGSNQKHQTDTDPSPSACPSPGTLESQTRPEAKPSPQNGAPGESKSSADWWLVYFTGGLVAAALAQLIAMVVQAHYLRRGLQATDRALEIAERPYISLAIGAYSAAAPFRVDYSTTNRGRTIAWITSGNAALTVTNSEARPEYPQYGFNASRSVPSQSIGTGRSIWKWSELEHAGDKDLEGLRAGSLYLHFFAYVNYRDARGKLYHSELGALFRFKGPNSVEMTYPADHTYQGDT